MMSLLVPIVNSHSFEEDPVTQSTEDYDIEFSTTPKFPVTGRKTHMDFIIKSKEGIVVSDLKVGIEVHQGQKMFTLNLDEEQPGHYNTEFYFREPGEGNIHLIIEGEELGLEFNIEVDTFGRSGFIRSSTIIILLLILVILMLRSCRRKKNGKKS